MASIPTPRGIRNNNPGNIRHGQLWQGLAKTQTDPSFDQFVSPQYGIRAIVKILLTYQARGLNTVREIITTWAPPSENNTDAYVKAVADYAKVGKDDTINPTNKEVMIKLVEAIILHENGQQPYTDEVVGEGIDMALKSIA